MHDPLHNFHAYKKPSHALVEKILCVTRDEELSQTRVRCFQHLSPSCAEHLTLAWNSSFSPLVAQVLLFNITLSYKKKQLSSPVKLKNHENQYMCHKKYGVHLGLSGPFELVCLQYSSSVRKSNRIWLVLAHLRLVLQTPHWV